MRAVYNVQVISRDSGESHWVRTEASSREEALSIVTKLGEIVGAASLVEIIGDSTSQARPHSPLQWAPNGVRIPMLISAIANIIVGLLWALSIVGIVLAIPMWVLCVFEFRAYGRLDRPPTKRTEVDHLRTLAIFEIAVGVFNTVALVCGIISLVNHSSIRRQVIDIQKRSSATHSELPIDTSRM